MKYYKLKDSVGRGDYPEYKRDRSYCETEKIREGGITVGELALTYPSDWEEVVGPETITINTDVLDISWGFTCRLCEQDVSIQGDPFSQYPPTIPVCDDCMSTLGTWVKFDRGLLTEPLIPTDTGRTLNIIREKTARAKEQYDMGFRDGMKKATESPLRIVVLKPLSKYYRKVLNKLMPVVQHSNSLEELWHTVSSQEFLYSFSYDVANRKDTVYIHIYESGDDSIKFKSGPGDDVIFKVEEKNKRKEAVT